jgi:hypothetical protein
MNLIWKIYIQNEDLFYILKELEIEFKLEIFMKFDKFYSLKI